MVVLVLEIKKDGYTNCWARGKQLEVWYTAIQCHCPSVHSSWQEGDVPEFERLEEEDQKYDAGCAVVPSPFDSPGAQME
jgi:hypothetical protein